MERIGITPDQFEETTVYRAVGCENCFHTGYKGRTGIFEIMLLDSSLKSLILTTYDSSQIKNAALNLNMVTLRQDGIQKVLSGISTIEEIIRVTQQ